MLRDLITENIILCYSFSYGKQTSENDSFIYHKKYCTYS